MAKQLSESGNGLQSWAYLRVGSRLAGSRLKCSEWAIRNRVLKSGPWSFEKHPFLLPVHDVDAREKVICKGSQVGLTETAINITLHAMDTMMLDAMYLLPTADDASDFSAGRFNPAIQMSPHLSMFFTDTDNVGHKRAGSLNLYVRGTNSIPKLKSVPADMVIKDEHDEMNQNNIDLADERMAGSEHKIKVDLSTPTIPDYGISKKWNESQQNRWYARCPHCNKLQHLEFKKNIEWKENKPESARFFCSLCKKPWTEDVRLTAIQKGELVAETKRGDAWGMHISQLYSPTVTAVELVKYYLTAQMSETKMTVFMNSKLGQPYIADGARLTDAHFEPIIRPDYKAKASATFSTMGVDIASVGEHYFEVAVWPRGKKVKQIIAIGRASVAGLHVLMKQYAVRLCIVDAQPERKLARDFCSAFPGRVYAAFYTEGMTKMYTRDRKEKIVKLHRTESIDNVIASIKMQNTIIPSDVQHLTEYKEHLKNVIRTVKTDAMGRPIARYMNIGPDHYLHASNYNGIAGMIAGRAQGASAATGEWAHKAKDDNMFGVEMPDEFYGI